MDECSWLVGLHLNLRELCNKKIMNLRFANGIPTRMNLKISIPKVFSRTKIPALGWRLRSMLMKTLVLVEEVLP